jgi:hypothetical protein
VRAEVAIGSARVAIQTHPLGDVEHNRDRQHVMFLRERDEMLARVRLDVGGVDHRQPAGGEPLPGDVVQDVEGVTRCGLVVLVIGDEAATEIAADDLRRQEVPRSEGRLSGPTHTD